MLTLYLAGPLDGWMDGSLFGTYTKKKNVPSSFAIVLVDQFNAATWPENFMFSLLFSTPSNKQESKQCS